VTAALSALLSVASHIFADMTEIGQGIQSVVHFKNDIAAATAIAAVRTASSYEKFPAEADMTVTAFSGSDINFCTVGKHKYLLLI